MKHAYLIIAHNEHEVLQRLIAALDDERNDVYLHIDKKATFDGSRLQTKKSHLYLLTNRIDARWGDFSLVEVELALFREAYHHGPYAYYHLLSGVDLPIQSQDYIHQYCQDNVGTEFIGFSQNVTDKELRWRSQHYFVFSRTFQDKTLWKRLIRAAFARIQTLIGYRRFPLEVKKGAQWCSITHMFVGYLLSRETYIRKHFNHTYCPDELVIQTLCWNSEFRSSVYSYSDEFEGCKRYINWSNGVLCPITIDDLTPMKLSGRWFARKFNRESMRLVDVLIEDNLPGQVE